MTDLDIKKDFSEKLLDFYKNSLESTLNSIKILSDIQKTYPSAYQDFKKIKNEPFNEDFLKQLPDEFKEKIMLFIMKSSSLTSKLANLFDSSIDDKNKIVVEFESFITQIENLKKEIKNDFNK